jgi:cell division protein FtsL
MKKLFKSIVVVVVLISSGILHKQKKSLSTTNENSLLWEISGKD